MKKLFQILFFVFVCSCAFSQEGKDSLQRKESRWSLGISAAPIYTFHTYPHHIDDSYKPITKWQYGVGVICLYEMKNLYLALNTSYDLLAYGYSRETSPSPFPQPSKEREYHYSLWDFNLLLGTKLIRKPKVKLSFVVGPQIGILSSNFVVSYPIGYIKHDFQNGDKIVFLLVGLGCEYKINKNFKLFIEPRINLGLNAISPYPPGYYEEYNRISFVKTLIGLQYKFKKNE